MVLSNAMFLSPLKARIELASPQNAQDVTSLPGLPCSCSLLLRRSSFCAPNCQSLKSCFLRLLQDVQRARAQNSLGSLNPIPYPVIFANCILCVTSSGPSNCTSLRPLAPRRRRQHASARRWITYGILKYDWFLFLGNATVRLLGPWQLLLNGAGSHSEALTQPPRAVPQGSCLGLYFTVTSIVLADGPVRSMTRAARGLGLGLTGASSAHPHQLKRAPCATDMTLSAGPALILFAAPQAA